MPVSPNMSMPAFHWCRESADLSAALRPGFHRPATAVMVATESLETRLAGRMACAVARLWSRDVDVGHFPADRGCAAAALRGRRALAICRPRRRWRRISRPFLALDLSTLPTCGGRDGPARRQAGAKYPRGQIPWAPLPPSSFRPASIAGSERVRVFPAAARYVRALWRCSGWRWRAGLPVAALSGGRAPVTLWAFDCPGGGALDDDLRKTACLQGRWEIARHPGGVDARAPSLQPRKFLSRGRGRLYAPPGILLRNLAVEPDED